MPTFEKVHYNAIFMILGMDDKNSIPAKNMLVIPKSSLHYQVLLELEAWGYVESSTFKNPENLFFTATQKTFEKLSLENIND
jgi:hypothetical protein